MSIKMIAIVLSSALFLLVIDLIRREKLTFKYAMVWLIIALIGVFMSVFHRVLFTVSEVLGFILPSNFIFFTLLVIFSFLSLILTVFLCQQNKRNDTMAQKIALLEEELKRLQSQRN